MSLIRSPGQTYDVQAVPFQEQGKPGALATFHDISELVRLERVRKDFISNISHELRTPLAAIRGYTETLLGGALEDPEHNRRFLEIIAAHTARLSDLVSDVLTLSDLDNDRGMALSERVSVLAVARSALRQVEAEVEARKVHAFLGTAEDAYVKAPKFALERTILNLLQNAIKYNREKGEVRVDVRSGDGSVRISVLDTGIGIPQEHLSRIFERFYRVDKARSRETGGTGLGLSIVKNATERMGGYVTIESELGKGSVFTLVLPAA
jgi:two-component system phosphate regulon sensor histidine kinase PhoR